MTEKDRMDLGRRRREQRARRRKGRGRRALLVFLAAMALTRSVKTAQLRQDAPERDESNWEMAEISGTRPPVEELASAGSETPKMPEELVEVPETPEVLEDDWQLLLVNPWNSMPEGYRVELKRLRNGHAVDARAYPDLQRMLDDCRAAGLRPLICSSYRSQETQQRLYENKIRQLMRDGYIDFTIPQDFVRQGREPLIWLTNHLRNKNLPDSGRFDTLQILCAENV